MDQCAQSREQPRRSANYMRVAMLSSLLSRNAGGLFTSVREFARALQCADLEVRVFGAQDEHMSVDVQAWKGVDICPLAMRGPRTFAYLPELMEKMRQFRP